MNLRIIKMKRTISTILFTIFCTLFTFAQKSEEISIISFNIRLDYPGDKLNNWQYRKEHIIRMIQIEHPAVLCTQELLNNQRLYLAESLPEYEHIGVGRDDGEHGGEHMAIFYRHDLYELLSHGNFWLSETPEHVSCGWDAACNRITTWGYFKSKETGNTFYCFNTHLDHVGKIAREESIKLILNKINEISTDKFAAIFLAGDFNTTCNDSIFSPLSILLKETRTEAPQSDNCGTYHNFGKVNDNIVIDHIFFKNAQPKNFQTLNKNIYGTPYISDHFPVKAIYQIDPYPIGCSVNFNFRGEIYEGTIVDRNDKSCTISFYYKQKNEMPLSALFTTSTFHIINRIESKN